MKPTSSERWNRIQELFHSALERDPRGRAAFLAAACADDASMQIEIESLLAADEKASRFLQYDSDREAAPLETGCSVGAYRIVGLIGRGGMGEVYRARDTRLEREVAIKVLPRLRLTRSGHEQPKRHTPEAAALSRFEQEALLTAGVQHPAVVPIYERGELPDGRPFYAMKLVSGRSLRELIDERKSLADRMALLPNVIAVAEALAHAHWQRVVHRDVKPSNVVVGEFGETILIDWGLAKGLTREGEEPRLGMTHPLSERTSVGEVIGTPAYMSPEQAKGLPVDERGDVFALGAMLYDLLTGHAPYEGATPTILPEVKRGHFTPLSEKQPDVPGELAAIVGKAMASERSQRYPTAKELAEDLRRFQAGQLVLSHRYSTGELVRRWAKRHRAVLLASAVFLAFAVAGGGVGLRKIISERDRANREAEASNRVSQFMTEMFKVSDPSESRGNKVTAREILDKASRQVETGLAKDPAVESRLMDTMAQVYESLGLYAKARVLADKAAQARSRLFGPEHPDTLRSLYELANVKEKLGEYAAAAEDYRKLLDLRRRTLGPQHVDTLRAMHGLANVEFRQGHYAAAEKYYRELLEARRRLFGPEHAETLRTMNNLAVAYQGEGRYAAAAEVHAKVVEVNRRLVGPEHVDTVRAMSNLIIDEAGQGHYRAAEKLSREVLEIRKRVLGPNHPDTLRSMNNLAEANRVLGQYAEAEALYQQLFELYPRSLGPEHPDILRPMSGLGGLKFAMKRFAEAEKIRTQVVELSRRVLGPEHPKTLSWTSELAEAQSALGKLDDAEKLCRQTLETQRRILPPGNPEALMTMMTLANVLAREGRYEESEKLHLETLAIRQRVLGPIHPDIGLSLYGLATLALRQGERRKALDFLSQAVAKGLAPTDVKRMQQDDDLSALHDEPEFEALVARGLSRDETG